LVRNLDFILKAIGLRVADQENKVTSVWKEFSGKYGGWKGETVNGGDL
jgi:hypothetical protein